MAVVALLICGVLLATTGVLNEHAGAALAAPEPVPGCGLTSPTTRNASQLSGAEAINFVSGDALFKANCAQCHALNDVVVGPALAGITKRRPMSWLIPWIKNSSKLIASGDEQAVKIYEQYQKQQMPSFNLSDIEITQILYYIETVEAQEVTVAGN
ncbi:hypothetical protein D0N36_19140 [Hymenobacter lapidiphilus]|nr:hypothetical protein D0N36_19140 [Hymenobacter sp. CCM 8763]